MNNTLLNKIDTKEENTNQGKQIVLPYFIEIKKAENKKIKIPCSNEKIAKKVLASHANNNSNCKVSLM